MGILTSRNPDTPEGLKSQLSIRIHRISAELPHSIELDLRKLHRIWTDSGRVSALKLLRGLPTSREVLQPSEPRLSLSTLQRMNLGALYGAKPYFLHTFYQKEYRGIYKGAKSVLWPKVGLGWPTCQAGRLARWPAGQVSWPHRLWALDARAPTFLDTLAKWSLTRRQHLAGQP
jgi:hypothetical protein